MIIKKKKKKRTNHTSHTPYIENGPVQRVEVEESTRHKWVMTLKALA